MRICTKCLVLKLFIDFHKDKYGKFGISATCKECKKKITTEYRKTQQWNDTRKKWNEKNKDNIYKRNNYNRSKGERRESVLKYSREYYNLNKDTILNNQRNNRIKVNEYNRNYSKNKRKEDVQYRLRRVLRERFKYALKGNFKSGSAVRDLGCSIEELKIYLESKFKEGMTWDNYGFHGWHIDHIYPLSRVDLTNREQLLRVFHYTNLQPLWANENMKKGCRI